MISIQLDIPDSKVQDIDKLGKIATLLDKCNDKAMLNYVKRLCNYWLYAADHPGWDDTVRAKFAG